MEALARMELNYSGWSLWIRHRHYGGLFTDCPTDEFDSLTHNELCDVLEAITSEWTAQGPDKYLEGL